MKTEKNQVILVSPVSHTHYVVPPIGLGYLATALRASGFSGVSILDCVKEKLSFSGLRERMRKYKPVMVGFQIFSYDFESVLKSINMIKEINPATTIVIGGAHVSATGISALDEMREADFAFEGEGETGFPLLVSRILGGKRIPWTEIPGLIWRENGAIHRNPRTVIKDLDSLGFPAWDLIRPDSYPDSPQGGFYKKFPIAPISTTRGCPYFCSFCASGVNMGHTLRVRSLKHVLDEMDLLYRDFGIREFHIIDDMFNFSKERVMEFCQAIKRNKWDISYTFPNGLRLNHLDKDILSAMKETGAYSFTVGIESGSQRILEAMKKNLTLELIEERVNLINSAGLEPNGFFIIGYPGESIEDIKATIRFAKRLKLKRAHFSNFLPLPGTEATKRLVDSGEIRRPDWKFLFYSKVAYSPAGITKRQLKNFQRRAFLEFHCRPRIILRLLSEIRSLNHLKIILKRAVDYLFRT